MSSDKKINLTQIYYLIKSNLKNIVAISFAASLLATIIVLIIPVSYSSKAIILAPGNNVGLSSILPSSMVSGLGSTLGSILGATDDETNKTLIILNSRTLKDYLLDKYKLNERFERTAKEDEYQELESVLNFTVDDDGSIAIQTTLKTKYFHPDSDEEYVKNLVRDITNDMVAYVDSTYNVIQNSKSKDYRILIEQKYNASVDSLLLVENEMKELAQKYGIVNIESQTKSLIDVLSKFEYEIYVKKIELDNIVSQLGENSYKAKSIREEIRILSLNYEKIYNGVKSDKELSVLPSMKAGIDASKLVLELHRKYETNLKIFQFVTQMYEQAKLQESDVFQKITIIDYGIRPTKKIKPSRGGTVILTGILTSFAVIIILIFKQEFNAA